jgi:hypothetical protein
LTKRESLHVEIAVFPPETAAIFPRTGRDVATTQGIV